MTTAPVYGGPLKRTLIQRAFGLCGISSTESELEPEELRLGLQCMNDLAAQFSGIPFNFPGNHSDGNANEESGLPSDDVLGFVSLMAREIGPNIGRDYQPSGTQKLAVSVLHGKYQTIPQRELNRQTIRGAGNRYVGWSPYFITDVSPDEPVQ